MARSRNLPRTAFTLVELLVVITILVILVALALPLMRPSLESREIREAARQVNSFVASAQIRARTLGRPVGVMFHRQGGQDDKWASFRMSLAQVPPPYSGDAFVSRAVTGFDDVRKLYLVRLTRCVLAGSTPGFLNVGDRIKFDYRGHLFDIQRWGFDGQFVNLELLPRLDNVGPPLSPQNVFDDPLSFENPSAGVYAGMPFQVFRRPQKTPGIPLELAPPAIVDLWWSGTGSSGFREFLPLPDNMLERPNQDDPVIITFSPSGRIDRIYHGIFSLPVMAPIHLLIGRADNQLEGPITNLRDANNMWVTIGNAGTVLTSPNNGQPNLSGQDVLIAREYTRRSQGAGGR